MEERMCGERNSKVGKVDESILTTSCSNAMKNCSSAMCLKNYVRDAFDNRLYGFCDSNLMNIMNHNLWSPLTNGAHIRMVWNTLMLSLMKKVTHVLHAVALSPEGPIIKLRWLNKYVIYIKYFNQHISSPTVGVQHPSPTSMLPLLLVTVIHINRRSRYLDTVLYRFLYEEFLRR